MKALLLLLLPAAFAAEPINQKFYPAGGGSFEVSLFACDDKAAVLNGRLANQTDTSWLYVELQVEVSQGKSTTTYRFNLERIGADGKAIRHRIEGPAGEDCSAIRLSDLQLIAAYSEDRAAKKKE